MAKAVSLGNHLVEISWKCLCQLFLHNALDSVDDLSFEGALEHVNEAIPEAAMDFKRKIMLVERAEVVAARLNARYDSSVVKGLGDQPVSEGELGCINGHFCVSISAEDTVMSMEVVSGEFGGELVQLDLEAVVCDIVDEVEVVCGLCDCEVVFLDVHLVVSFASNVWDLDAVDSVLDHPPIGLFGLLEHGSVSRNGHTIAGGI